MVVRLRAPIQKERWGDAPAELGLNLQPTDTPGTCRPAGTLKWARPESLPTARRGRSRRDVNFRRFTSGVRTMNFVRSAPPRRVGSVPDPHSTQPPFVLIRVRY
jgi:hypothetical protein